MAEFERIGEDDTSASMPDLAALAQEMGIPSAMLPQVEQLSEQISSTIREHLTDAFSSVFPWAAGIVGIGIIPAILLKDRKRSNRRSSPKETGETRTEQTNTPPAEAGAPEGATPRV